MSITRQRGVRASRPKLERLLREAGLKSQADLARRIADMERLESPPKDLVNRVFRQQNVEYASLERVARALQVDSYQLYLSKEDLAQQKDTVLAEVGEKAKRTPTPARAPAPASTTGLAPRRFRWGLLWGGFVLVLCGVLVLAALWPAESSAPVQLEPLPAQNTLLYPRHKTLYPLASELVREQGDQRLALLPQALHEGFALEQALTRYEVDQVLVLEAETVGRYRLLHIQRYTGKALQPLASFVLSHNELRQAPGYFGRRVTELATFSGEPPPAPQQDARLLAKARQLAEQYYDTERMARAEALLADIQQPVAASLALRCLIQATVAWHSDEKAGLSLARSACDQALALDARAPFVGSAQAYLLLRNGEFEAAELAYEAQLERYPGHIESLLGMADLHMQRYLQAPENGDLHLQEAISLAREAIAREPDYWRSYQHLSQYYYLAKQTEEALRLLEKLTDLAPHPLSLANAALLNLCHRRMVDAETYAQRLLAMDESSYIALETLFQIASYQQRPAKALDAMERAMRRFDQTQGGLYLQWGELGDAYRRAGKRGEAVASYEEALVEFSQDRAKGLLTEHDSVFALYFAAAIAGLQGEALGDELETSLSALDLENMPSSHQLRAATLFYWLGQGVQAVQVRDMAAAACPVYGDAPDLANL